MPSSAKPQIISSLQHMRVFHWLPWGLLCVLGRGSSCLPREEVDLGPCLAFTCPSGSDSKPDFAGKGQQLPCPRTGAEWLGSSATQQMEALSNP